MTRPRFTRKLLKLSPLLGGAVALTAFVSCNEFDPDLYKNAQSGGTGATGATGATSSGGVAGSGQGGTAGTETGGAAGSETGGAAGAAGEAPFENWAAIRDWCPVPDDQLLTSAKRVHTGTVALNSLVSDVAEVPKVPGLGGPDGVFMFRVAAQQRVAVRYEFTTAPGPDVDLAMYLMGSCGTVGFIRRNDRCPHGAGEDLWWQMNDTASTYWLGFDSKDYDQTAIDPKVKLTVSFPLYGDGIVDDGEACDDSNKNDGDGCTHDGLYELKYSGSIVQEKEPNDHPFGGNVVLMSVGQTMTISGSTSGTCDNDFFSIDVPQGAFPRVTMLNGNGQDCAAAEYGVISMQLNRLDGTKNLEQVKLGDGKPVGANACPSWTETSLGLSGLAAGRYGIELKGFEVGKKTLPYRLKIELVDLSGGGT
jgi:cysteine-rich repeat protein